MNTIRLGLDCRKEPSAIEIDQQYLIKYMQDGFLSKQDLLELYQREDIRAKYKFLGKEIGRMRFYNADNCSGIRGECEHGGGEYTDPCGGGKKEWFYILLQFSLLGLIIVVVLPIYWA